MNHTILNKEPYPNGKVDAKDNKNQTNAVNK